jgi:hypothetical protein
MASDAIPLVAAGAPGECETYRAYVASTGGAQANAADLNAGMLAELRGGGAPCSAPAPAAPGENRVD